MSDLNNQTAYWVAAAGDHPRRGVDAGKVAEALPFEGAHGPAVCAAVVEDHGVPAEGSPTIRHSDG
ncbi:hypothetical protein M2283_002678 [Streptomyces pseudovenezuelae]|uniref:Uncharacterized protein n=1 Tax=Streptomyces pseudovenezuelae TaxID=67350 RepID=A0ABT6LHV7_9ACTN|nr:hypothetical protein [Streptomyces pseudovenezuelae]